MSGSLGTLVNTGQLGVFAIGVSAFCVVILVAAGGSAGLDGSVKSSWASCSIGSAALDICAGSFSGTRLTTIGPTVCSVCCVTSGGGILIVDSSDGIVVYCKRLVEVKWSVIVNFNHRIVQVVWAWDAHVIPREGVSVQQSIYACIFRVVFPV